VFFEKQHVTMANILSISPADILGHYSDEIRNSPEIVIRVIVWLTIYDGKSSSWARNFLEKYGVLPKPAVEANIRADAKIIQVSEIDREINKIKKAQLRLIDRQRVKLEKSVGLPSREKRGTTPDYELALYKWKQINPRPTNEDFLAGWTPKPLHDFRITRSEKEGSQDQIVAIGVLKLDRDKIRNGAPNVRAESITYDKEQTCKAPYVIPSNNRDLGLPTLEEVSAAEALLDADDEADAAFYSSD
jgi:hypothetical protein